MSKSEYDVNAWEAAGWQYHLSNGLSGTLQNRLKESKTLGFEYVVRCDSNTSFYDFLYDDHSWGKFIAFWYAPALDGSDGFDKDCYFFLFQRLRGCHHRCFGIKRHMTSITTDPWVECGYDEVIHLAMAQNIYSKGLDEKKFFMASLGCPYFIVVDVHDSEFLNSFLAKGNHWGRFAMFIHGADFYLCFADEQKAVEVQLKYV